MDRRKRPVSIHPEAPMSCCAVCGVSDERMLAIVQLRGGTEATLCGSHALMHARSKADLRSIADLRAAFADRRERARRAPQTSGDELADRLQSAFTRERRTQERRAG